MTFAEIEAQARRAEHLCELGRWAEAERVLRTVLASVPDDRDALSRLTEVLEHLARPHDAAEVAQLLVTTHPEEPDGYLALAEALAFQGEHGDAEPLVRAALDLDPQAPIAWQQLSEVLSHLPGRADEAIAAARQAVALDPHDADSHACLGDALLTAAGDGPGAQAAYRHALALTPDDGGVRLRLGLARLQVGRIDDAVQDFMAGLAQEPTARHVRTLHRILQLLGVPDRFAELYATTCVAVGQRAAVDRTHPEVVDSQLDMAITWWNAGARAAALELLETLVEANPDSVDGLATLAEYRFESGRPDDAETLAQRALAVDPQTPAALFVLGLIHDSRTDPATAAAWFDRLRALPVDAEDRQWMRDSLLNHGLAARYPTLTAWAGQTTTDNAAGPATPSAPRPGTVT